MSGVDAGWYPEPQDERWWDGRAWSEVVRRPGEIVPEPPVVEATGEPLPGWYPDPLVERYWTGSTWSEQRRRADAVAPPTVTLAKQAPAPQPPVVLAKAPDATVVLAKETLAAIGAPVPAAPVGPPPAAPAPPAPPEPAGSTAPARRGAPTALLVAVGVLAVVAIVVGGLALTRGGDEVDATDAGAVSDPTEEPAEDVADDETTTSTSTSTSTSTTTTTAPTTTLDPEQQALEELTERVAADRVRADRELLEAWVPQLASRQLGLNDPRTGITYDTYQAIVDDLRRHESAYGDVLLLDSGAFSTYSQPGLYVIVAPIAHPTPEAANGWCDGQGIHPDDCFAKLISHTTPSGPHAQTYRS